MNFNWFLRNIRNRIRKAVRELYVCCGSCPDCGTFLNYTSQGRAVCPSCGTQKP